MPRFVQINEWLKEGKIGEVRHISWNLYKAPNKLDLSGAANWRTDHKVAPGGYFDDLASHGLDLFTFFLGNIKEVFGVSLNQQQLYAAKDAISACWLHEGGATGAGSWNFGCDTDEDRVEILGSKGKVTFSVFDEKPLLLEGGGNREEIFIENPKHVQLNHVEDMKKQLLDQSDDHPSTGRTATHTSWVMDKILGNIND